MTITDVFELLGADADSGVLMGEVDMEFDGSLRPGATYEGDGEIAAVERKHRARAGLSTGSSCAHGPRGGAAEPVLRCQAAWIFPRGRLEMRLEAGQTVTPYVVESVSPEPMKTMAAILDDPNPIHYDEASVRALGLGERPINQGPSNLGYLMEMLVGVAGRTERLKRVRVRFLGNVLAGDRVGCSGSVCVGRHRRGARGAGGSGERRRAAGSFWHRRDRDALRTTCP